MIATKCFVFRFSDIEVREDEFRATRAGQPLEIEPKAFRVLVHLIKHAGHLVSKNELMDAVWGETAVSDNSLTRAIALLRRVLEDDPHQPYFIETVSTAGYRFICPVTVESDGPSSAGESTAALEDAQLSASATMDTTACSGPRHRRWPWALSAGFVAAIGITGAAWWEWWSVPSVPHVTSIDRITNDGFGKSGVIATDGTRVYFSEVRNNHVVLAQASSSGGNTSTIPTPVVVPQVVDIVPDHTSLLISDYQWNEPSPLWILPLPQGAARRVGSVLAEDATLTPDGKRIIFTRGDEIWICAADGSQMRKLLTAPGAWGPRVSPDGKRIRFPACDPSGCALWEARIDGMKAHRVLTGWQEHTIPGPGAWSPDGRYFAFGAVTPKGAYHSNQWVLPEHRGWFSRRPAPVPLTQGPLCFGAPGVFSPDGRTLFALGRKDDSQLVRYDPKAKKAEPFLGGIPGTQLDFSRDGQWVVYVTSPYPSLWRCRRDGSERVQLTSSDDSEAGIARWSPDGTKMAFQWTRAGQEMKLGLISRDGGTPEQLIADKDDSQEQGDPTWGPDGNEIIFARERGNAKVERMELLRVDLQTRKVTAVPGSEGLFSPRWSPDGRYLAAFTIDMHTIRLFDFQRQVWTTWFTAQEDVAWDQWSPDSKALYFLNNETKDAPLAWWRIGLGGHTPTKLMELPDERTLGGFTIGPDGSSYFTRDLTSDEIYAIHLSYK